MSDLQILIEEVARIALESQDMSQHIGHELDASDEELEKAHLYLQELLRGESKMTEQKFINEDQLYAWLGSDTLKVHELTALILEIVNGKYPVEILRDDILDYETEE